MALPDFQKYAFGTAIIWGESTATGGYGDATKTLAIDALAAGSAWMGESADLGASWDQEYLLIAAIESGTAPTAGLSVDVYLAWSHDGTHWPNGITGSSGAFPADGNEDEHAKQLGIPSTCVIATNDANTVQGQNARTIRAHARYVAVVVDNNWDQAIRNQTTNTDNLSRILLVPKRSLIQDAA